MDKIKESTLEIIVAVFLAVTALATAWATWIGSLHGGNQATNYTTSNNLSADGNSLWNEGSQSMIQDMEIWNKIYDCSIEITYAEENNDEVTKEKYEWKLEQLMNDNLSETFSIALDWALDSEDDVTPFMYVFENETKLSDGTVIPAGTTFVESYYLEASDVLAESSELLEKGKKDNANGDAFGLVTVIYSVVLFLLGIAGTLKKIPNRAIIVIVAIVGFLVGTIYMFTIPMPTGFSMASFFKH